MGDLREKGPDAKIDIWHVSMGRMQKWYGVYERGGAGCRQKDIGYLNRGRCKNVREQGAKKGYVIRGRYN